MTVFLWLHGPGHHDFSVQSFSRFSVPPCRHVTRRPCHRTSIPPCHLPHNPTEPPATNMPEQCRRDTWCATVPPPCHHRATVPPVAPLWHYCAPVPPPYRNDTSTYFCTPTHLAYFTTHLTAVNHTSVPPELSDAISPYGLLLIKSHDYFNGFSRKTMSFPINISQYCAIRKSKISHNEEVNR